MSLESRLCLVNTVSITDSCCGHCVHLPNFCGLLHPYVLVYSMLGPLPSACKNCTFWELVLSKALTCEVIFSVAE